MPNQVDWSSCGHSFGTGFSLLEDKALIFFLTFVAFQPMEIYVDDEAKLTLHGLVQVRTIVCCMFGRKFLICILLTFIPMAALHQIERVGKEPEIE